MGAPLLGEAPVMGRIRYINVMSGTMQGVLERIFSFMCDALQMALERIFTFMCDAL